MMGKTMLLDDCGLRIADCGIKTPNSELRTLNFKGVTLIEVILVMVIIGILAAIVIPKTDITLTSGTSVNGAAYMIASDIRYAQEWAMANRTSKSISFTSGQSSYTSPDTGGLTYLPSGVMINNNFSVTFNSLGEPITTNPPGVWSVTVLEGSQSKIITVWDYTGKVDIS